MIPTVAITRNIHNTLLKLSLLPSILFHSAHIWRNTNILDENECLQISTGETLLRFASDRAWCAHLSRDLVCAKSLYRVRTRAIIGTKVKFTTSFNKTKLGYIGPRDLPWTLEQGLKV